MIGRAFIVVTFVVISITSAAGQMDRLRMARVYEEGGDIRNAARLYIEIYDAETGQVKNAAFDGVVRTLTELGQHQSLAAIVDKEFERRPSASLAVLAARTHARSGDPAKADDWWKKAVDLGKDAEPVHAEIARDQRQLLLFDRSIESYLRARARSGQPLAYAADLADLYAVKGQTGLAVNEVLNMHSTTGNFTATQGRLAALMTNDSAKTIIKSTLEDRNVAGGDRLRLWYLEHVGDWEGALGLARKIDRQEDQRGNELLRFASQARREGAYDVALSAYSDLLKGKDQVAMAAAYGYARTLDDRLVNNKRIDKAQARSIIEQYQRIVDQHADHPLSAEAMLRMAALYDDVLGDGSSAREILVRLTNRWRGTISALEGSLQLAAIYYAARQDAAASDLLRQVANMQNNQAEDLQDRALVELADLHLFSGHLDSALAIYTQLSARPNSIAANDAIHRLGILILREEDSVGVDGYVKGLELRHRRSIVEAARSFAQAAEASKNTDMADRNRLEAALSFVEAGMTDEATRLLNAIVGKIPTTLVGDRALVLIADILEDQGDREGAITALTTLLVQYPRSIYAPTSRERIRKLRGDA
jgi:tetratricopeptide (TPR) repeat protein